MRVSAKGLFMSAALLLLAACETAPLGSVETSGAGAAGGGDPAPAAPAEEVVTAVPPAAAPPVISNIPDIAPGSERDFLVNVGDRVYFDFDRSDIRADGQSVLVRQARWLTQYPRVTVQIEGHADERGTREYNLALGERRANAVREYLVGLGVAAERISVISYGKERPVAEGSNEEAWALNRRGVTRIVSGGAR